MTWPDDFIGKIINADCLEVMREMPDNSVDMIFTDPPYGHNNNNGDLIHRWEAALGILPSGSDLPQGRPIANDGAEANGVFKAVLPHFKRILKPGSCCCCCCCGGGGDLRTSQSRSSVDEKWFPLAVVIRQSRILRRSYGRMNDGRNGRRRRLRNGRIGCPF